MKAFTNVPVYLEGEGIKRCNIVFDEKIKRIGGSAEGAEVISLPEDALVLPGFIDEHIHGAGGADAMDGTHEALKTIACTIAAEGTTGFLATTMTQSPENILKAMRAVKEYRESDEKSGARVLGIHLEGPFISAQFAGAQPLEYVAKPEKETFDRYNAASGNAIKIVTLAPEAEGAEELIAHLTQTGVVSSVGHTKAKSTDIERAISLGASNVTHTYNAQSPLHHREIGTVGSAMLYDELNCELIADTVHVSVPAMKLLVKNKPDSRLTLITNAMRAKGLADGESELGGQKVIVKNGEARLQDGTLAGSVLRMNRAVQNLVEKVGVPLEKAVDCASLNPARTLKIDDETGSVRLGKRADFCVIDSHFNVICTVCGGELIYDNRA